MQVLQKQEIMEIQDNLTKIKSRQLGRLIGQLKAINTPQITLDAVEKYWNFFYLDIQDLIKENQANDQSNNQA